ncbi:glycosyltransferase family 4 protein [Fuchsiella alkaliacetigena]|uniref:glycosyltransferase family 4 protein n=1 Tax=Fuchsiella alkaliacetigena TaxID=957042 RepID=UPI00200B623E|nr:glycosyltransferase family 4 protein [Fuchsiella alkaliacetigena]
MKILFFCTKFPSSIGGMQKSNYEIVKAIKELGHKVFVLTIKTDQGDKDFDKNQNFSVERLDKSKKGSYYNLFKRISFFFRFYIKLIKKIKIFNPDKIIVADYFTRNIIGLFPISYKKDIIVITSVPGIKKVRNNMLLTGIRNLIIKNCYRKANQVICVSESTKKSLYDYYGQDLFKDKKINIVYRTLDEEYFNNPKKEQGINWIKDKYDIDQSKKIILSVSRMEKEKGIDNVLKVLKRFKLEVGDDFKYIVVGDGNYLDVLKEQTNELGINEEVIFTGRIDFDKVIHFYDLCDIFILPSRRETSESFGRVFAEASARGKPVIANRSGGVVEVVQDKETGFLVDPNNLDEIFSKLKIMYQNEDLCKKLGKKGMKFVRKNFTKEQLKNKIRTILSS